MDYERGHNHCGALITLGLENTMDYEGGHNHRCHDRQALVVYRYDDMHVLVAYGIV